MTNMKLYEITIEMENINNALEDADGEITPFIEELIIKTSKALEKKSDNIACYTRSLTDQLDLVKKRRKEVQELEKRIDGQISRFKDYVLMCMKRADIKKIEGPFSRISIPKQREVVNIKEDQLDDQYFKVTRTVDKQKIKDDLKAGKKVDGAWLGLGSESVSVKMK